MPDSIDQRKLSRLILEAEGLTPCPVVLAKVAQLSNDSGSNARDLGKIIAMDEALAAQLIKQVNSAYYGLRGTISTVTQAVVILGYQEIRHIIYAVQTAQLFRENAACPGVDILALWDHSLQVAALAREFSYQNRHPVPEEVFVAGVIHDMGQVLMGRLLGDRYRRCQAKVRADSADLAAAEQAAFGISHAEIGWQVTNRWNFPPSLQAAVRSHHDLAVDCSDANPGVVPMVLAANLACHKLKQGCSSEGILQVIPEQVREALRLNLVMLEEAMSAAASEHQRLRSSFDIASNGEDDDNGIGPGRPGVREGGR